MCLLSATHQGRNAADGDDATALRELRGHLISHRLHDVKCAIQIHILDAFPQVMWEVQERVERTDPGIGDQHVDPAECLDCGLHYRRCCRCRGDVTIHYDALSPMSINLSFDTCNVICSRRTEVMQNELRAVACTGSLSTREGFQLTDSRRCADTRTTACDDYDLSWEKT